MSHAHPKAARTLLFSLTVSSILLSSPLYAQSVPDLAVLQTKYGSNCPEIVQTELTIGVETALKESGKIRKFTSRDQTKSTLQSKSPALDGCLTPECLERSGTLLNTRYGLSLDVEGQAQIYDFSLTIFDLQNGGSTVFSDVDSCDICTPRQARSKIYEFTRRALKSIPSTQISTATKPKPAPKPNQPTRTVDIVTNPKEATIRLGQSVLGTGSVSAKLPVGAYSLRIEADGHQPADIPLTIDASTLQSGPLMMRLHLAPSSSTRVLVERNPGAFDNLNHSAIGWTSLGLGVASAVAGGILLSMDGDTTCDSGPITACPNVYNTTFAGGSLTAVGAVTITSGLFLLLWDELAGKQIAQ